MSAIQTSLSMQQSGSLLEKAKSGLAHALGELKQAGKEINDSVVKPVQEAYGNIKESYDIMREGASTLSELASHLAPITSLDSIGKASAEFNVNWDKFAADFNQKYKTIVSNGNGNVLETMVRSTMGDKVFEAGSIIKKETPGILLGVSSIRENLNAISNNDGTWLTQAKRIKNSAGKIIDSVKQIDSSLDNVFSRATNQLGINTNALIGLQNELRSLSGSLVANIPNEIKSSIARLEDGIDILDTGKTMIAALIADCQGDISIRGLASLTDDFDKNWDDFAQKANTLYSNLSGSNQLNILETFAKSKFGNNVFYVGSAIKNETPAVLGGISDFQQSINAFNGDYSNPLKAARTVRNGVEKIINATEKIAGSINNAIKIYNGQGNVGNAKSFPLLEGLSNIGDQKCVKVLRNTLALGNDSLEAGNNVASLYADLKAGNLSKAWNDLKASFNDAKNVKEDFENLINDKRAKLSNNGSSAQNNDGNKNEERKSNEDSSNEASASSNSYVCSGATLKCSFGDKTSRLSVFPDRKVFLTGQPMANTSDHISMYNINPFGKCHTTNYPPTGSATSANHGRLTPMPCVPGTIANWMYGKDDYIVKGQPALLKSSCCRCQWGGVITITNDGQVNTGKPDGNKERRVYPEEMKIKQSARMKLDTDMDLYF